MPSKSPKTVMFLDHTANMGGGEYALLHLVQRLDRSRYVPLVVLSSDGPLREKLVDSGVETWVFRLSPRVVSTRKDTLGFHTLLQIRSVLRTLGYCWKLSRFIKKRGIDMVHTNSLKADIIGGITARMAGVPVLWHIRDRIDYDYLPASVVRVFRWLCRVLPHHVITNSHSTLETLHLPQPVAATTIYSGVVGALTSALEPPVSVVHDGVIEHTGEDDGVGKPGPLIGMIGRITRWKGQHIFLQAAAKVREEFPDAHFQIVGESLFGEEDYKAELNKLIRDLGLSGHAELTGWVPNAQDSLEKMDILVHASITSEPFGLVVVEGMLAGKPVVATKGGGVLETVVDGVTGRLVKMGDADDMAAALKDLLKNPEQARAMGEAGRKRVQEHFTIELTVQRVQEVYDEVWRHRMVEMNGSHTAK